MTRVLPRYRTGDQPTRRRSLGDKLRQIEHDRATALALLEQSDTMPSHQDATDEQRLRGIPCIARGVGGTSPGTNPLTETIRREHRCAS